MKIFGYEIRPEEVWAYRVFAPNANSTRDCFIKKKVSIR
jgi:hypothetical protein